MTTVGTTPTITSNLCSTRTAARMIELNSHVAAGEPVEDVALERLRRFDVVG